MYILASEATTTLTKDAARSVVISSLIINVFLCVFLENIIAMPIFAAVLMSYVVIAGIDLFIHSCEDLFIIAVRIVMENIDHE